MKIDEIIQTIIDYSGLNPVAFAERIGAKTPQAIYDLLKGRTRSISTSMKNKILSCYPEISEVYLMTGQGNLLSSPEEPKDEASSPVSASAMRIVEEYSEYLKVLKKQLETKDIQIRQSNEEKSRLLTIIEMLTSDIKKTAAPPIAPVASADVR